MLIATKLDDWCTGIWHYRACTAQPEPKYEDWLRGGSRCHAYHVWFGDSPPLIGSGTGPCPNWGGDYSKPSVGCTFS